MLAGAAAAALDVSLLERRQPPLRVLADRFDQRQLGAAGLAAQLDAVRVLAPVRHVGHEIDAEDAARRDDARDRCRASRSDRAAGSATAGCRTGAITIANEPRLERQRADVAADETETRGRVGELATWSIRRARALEHRRRPIDADELDAGARQRQRDATGSASELQHAARGPATSAAARTARRGARASARSPSRRTARSRPSLASLHASFRGCSASKCELRGLSFRSW